MAITLMAIEGLAMATVAPVLADDLNGDRLYGWIFSAFLLAQIVGTVIGGREVDRRSPAIVFGAALGIFTAAGLIAGIAPTIEVFLVGRALQGFAAGLVISTSYAVINVLYEDRLRPAILAAESSAYILPSLLGPFVVGTIAEQLSWRLVFFGLVPFVIPVAVLVLPRFRTVQPARAAETRTDSRVTDALLLAIATGVFLIGLEIDQVLLAVLASVTGIAAMGVLLYRLLPRGTFPVKPVLPAAIVSRSMSFGTFLVAETYMVYSLKEFGGVSAGVAGILVTAGSLTWVAGSWLQARFETRTGTAGRPFRVATGVASMALGVGIIFGMITFFNDIWFFAALFGWLLTGLGIGFGLTTAAVVALAESPAGEEGKISSSMLLGDLVGASFGVGIGGVLLSFGNGRNWSAPDSVALAMVPALVFLAIGGFAAFRLRPSRFAVTRSQVMAEA